jgi:hypothetical protein
LYPDGVRYIIGRYLLYCLEHLDSDPSDTLVTSLSACCRGLASDSMSIESLSRTELLVLARVVRTIKEDREGEIYMDQYFRSAFSIIRSLVAASRRAAQA